MPVEMSCHRLTDAGGIGCRDAARDRLPQRIARQTSVNGPLRALAQDGRLAGSGIPAEVHVPLGLATPLAFDRRGAGPWLEGSALSDERAQEGVFAA